MNNRKSTYDSILSVAFSTRSMDIIANEREKIDG